jgi:hypothetical protein
MVNPSIMLWWFKREHADKQFKSHLRNVKKKHSPVCWQITGPVPLSDPHGEEPFLKN